MVRRQRIPGQHSALIMPNARLVVATAPPLSVRDLGRYLYEPAGAVIRAGAIAELGAQLGAGLLDSQVAYLTNDQLCSTRFAAAFEVRQRLPFHLKALRAWMRQARWKRSRDQAWHRCRPCRYVGGCA